MNVCCRIRHERALLGSWQVSWQLLVTEAEQARLKLIEFVDAERHCWSREVQKPFAHDSPPLPHESPSFFF